jgi:diguanylate cyclase (GGDEF)-like protein
MLTPRSRWVAASGGLFLAAFTGWLLFDLGGPAANSVGADVGAIVFSVFATGCAFAAAMRVQGRQRSAWICMAVGFAGWVVGDTLWANANLAEHTGPRDATLADLGYLMLPLATCAAALFSPNSRHPRAGLRLVLDGLIVATSTFLVLWSLLLRDLFADPSSSGLQFALSVAYPFTDLVMITIALMLLAKGINGFRRPLILITTGLLIIGVADVAYVHLAANDRATTDPVLIAWATGMFLAGLAGLSAQPRVVPIAARLRPPTKLSLWAPYLPVPFAIVLGARELWPTVGYAGPILVAGLLLILAALIRQFLLLDENRSLLVEVTDIALRDPVTGLANRALFNDRLTHTMQLRVRKAVPVAVLIADLNDFKLVNDSLGHPFGDLLLHAVGDRIQENVREWDTVARVGGDEFAVLIEDSSETVHAVARKVVESFDEPFVVDGRELYVRLSVGLATAPATGDADDTADELFKRADLAMYSAKRDHATGVRTFTPDMRLQATHLPLPSRRARTGRRDGVARIQLINDLRRAIDERELTLVYQPKVSLETDAVVGVEALVRWPHPNLGILEPADFLPLVRQNGLMEAVTDVVLARALEDAAGWYAAGVHIPVAVNLSAPSLNDESTPDRIGVALARQGLTADALSVEITEDLLLASVTRARTVLERLRQSGIRVAIDDFGSGYSTMTYLHKLPIDELKLDRHFVAPILHDERAAAIVRSVIELADTFGLSSVAEGVETKVVADRLREYGCDLAQGHYFSPPVPAQAVRLGMWGPPLDERRVSPAAAVRPSGA